MTRVPDISVRPIRGFAMSICDPWIGHDCGSDQRTRTWQLISLWRSLEVEADRTMATSTAAAPAAAAAAAAAAPKSVCVILRRVAFARGPLL